MGSVGTGFTGTAIWMDPATGLYDPAHQSRPSHGKGDVAELRRRVSAAVGTRFAPRVAAVPTVGPSRIETTSPAADGAPLLPEGSTVTGLDRLVADDFAPLAGRTVGLITNQTGIDAQGRRGVDLLAAAPQVKLKVLFSPEHGITGLVDANVPHSRDAATGLAIWSLYGPGRRPSPEQLAGIDTLVFDIQDVGVRYYTYLTTLVYALEEGGRRGIQVVVLDRPNPITGSVVEGPVMDADMRSFTAPPIRAHRHDHGDSPRWWWGTKLPVKLSDSARTSAHAVVRRDRPHVGEPSPNIRNQMQALLYAGVGLLEGHQPLGRARHRDAVRGDGAPQITDPRCWPTRWCAAWPGAVPRPSSPTSASPGARSAGAARVTDGCLPRGSSGAQARPPADGSLSGELPAVAIHLPVNRSTMWSMLRGDPFARLSAGPTPRATRSSSTGRLPALQIAPDGSPGDYRRSTTRAARIILAGCRSPRHGGGVPIAHVTLARVPVEVGDPVVEVAIHRLDAGQSIRSKFGRAGTGPRRPPPSGWRRACRSCPWHSPDILGKLLRITAISSARLRKR
jgi:hypothetical protein